MTQQVQFDHKHIGNVPDVCTVSQQDWLHTNNGLIIGTLQELLNPPIITTLPGPQTVYIFTRNGPPTVEPPIEALVFTLFNYLAGRNKEMSLNLSGSTWQQTICSHLVFFFI